MIDDKGIVVLSNRKFEQQFGYSRDELIGQPIEVLIPDRFRRLHSELRTGFLASPIGRTMGAGRDLFGLRKDGLEFPIEIGLNPIMSQHGPLTLAGVIDISQRKRAETAILAQNENLIRSNAELEQFAYVASHDLQEPLRMVASYTQLLSERYRGKLDEKADKYIFYAMDGVQRMQSLVRDLLAYSRVSAKEHFRKPVDMAVLLRTVLERLSALIQGGKARIRLGDLPSVDGDETEFGQVFQNLIANAIKFRAGDHIDVAIDARRQGAEWVFSVADNGIGIDPRYHQRIFQMFQRLHERDKYEGNGIGLAIAKKIVERHGGRISG